MTIIKSPFPHIGLRNVTITERMFEGLGNDPARVVMIDGPTGREVTAGQLIGGIKALAGGLIQRGLGKGSCIALMAPNLPEYCTVFHGVAWAGGTITTINPTYTVSEVRHQLNDSGATLLITIGLFLDTAREAIKGTGVTEIVVIGEADGATPLNALMGPPQETQVPVDLDADVVVLPYSSGTTGMPKGVMLTQRNLVANVDQILASFDVEDDEWTVAFLPFFHIYGMQVLMNLFLVARGGIITMPRFDLEEFLSLVQTHKVRQLYIVPPIAIALAKHPIVDKYDLSSVTRINSGAAPLGGDVAEAMGKRLNCEAVQGFGMTELSPVSHLTPRDAGRVGASGVTIANTESRIVDPMTGKDVVTGVEGEVLVRGPQVMKGYLNNPKATAETIDDQGWLHTGDIGRFDEDGYLYLTDRVKELIKYKAFQVAPAELEATLLTHPSIADTAVIGVPDDEAGELPMAFIVPAGDAVVTLADVQGFLEGKLAHYKQVRRIEIVDAIPKSASGKILRRVLRDKMRA